MNDETLNPWQAAAGDAKQNLILDAALQVFSELGLERATMDDVARRSGYSRRSLYRFFPTKDDLGQALALRCCQELAQEFLNNPSPTPAETAQAYLRFSREKPLMFRVVVDLRQYLAAGEDGGTPVLEALAAAGGQGEALAAALGYIEFRYRHGGGDEGTIQAMLAQIFAEDHR